MIPFPRFCAWAILVAAHGLALANPGEAALALEKDAGPNPPEFEWSEANVGKVFDPMWETMDRQYSYFFLKQDLDWNAAKEKYRPRAVQSKNTKELAAALQETLAPLRDMHVWIETPEGVMPTCRIPWSYNGNFQAALDQLENRTECGKFAVVGETKGEGFGCLLISRQSEANPADVQMAVAAIKKLRGAPGFIVDLRRANGGSESLAMELAKLFCGKETIYARSKYRRGPSHDDFSRAYERILPAVPEPYTKPVICLIGPGAVSSGEGFVQMMKALSNVVTVGLATRGASGNPKPWALTPTGVTVHFSRWVDLMPDGQTFEGIGIPPDVEVKEPASAYVERDPTLEKGIELLRRKVAPGTGVAPTLFLIGDSTVKNGSGKGEGALWGWGHPIAGYFDNEKIRVANRALGGRSSRTYFTEGLWDKVLLAMRPGDFVLIQFGHNDGGSIAEGDRPRASLKGNGDESREVTIVNTGRKEVVHSYGWYLRKYITDAKAIGATPIVLSPVPRNIWKDGKVNRAANDYGKWAAEAAKAEGAAFIDLNDIAAKHYEAEGPEKVQAQYFAATDHTHTTAAGARLNAASVIEGLQGLKDCPLTQYLAAAPKSPEENAHEK